jgi:hypothetical protein
LGVKLLNRERYRFNVVTQKKFQEILDQASGESQGGSTNGAADFAMEGAFNGAVFSGGAKAVFEGSKMAVGGRLLGPIVTAGISGVDAYKNFQHGQAQDGWGSVGGGVGGVAGGIAAGAAIGTFFGPGPGTVIGAAIGGAVVGIGGYFVGSTAGSAIAGAAGVKNTYTGIIHYDEMVTKTAEALQASQDPDAVALRARHGGTLTDEQATDEAKKIIDNEIAIKQFYEVIDALEQEMIAQANEEERQKNLAKMRRARGIN